MWNLRGLVGIILGLSMVMSVHSQATGEKAEPAGQSGVKTENTEALVAPKLTAAAKSRLAYEFDQIKQSSALAEWQKVDASKLPDSGATHEEKVRFKRKLLELLEFCKEERLQTLDAVDEMEFLTASDKQVCKDRLKLLNPFIE